MKQNNRKAGHLSEVADVCGEHRESQRKSCRTDEQVRVRNDHPAASLLSIQFPCEQSGLFGIGIHRQISEEFIEKRLAMQAQGWSIGAVKSMDQLGQSDRRERRLLIS